VAESSKSTGRVTIKSIANELGVSFSTVAKALKDDPAISEQTKQAVREKVRQLNYFPNDTARALRSSSTRTIGIILNDLENASYALLVKTITVALSSHGYSILVCDSQYDPEIERRNVLAMLSKRPDCLILSPCTQDSDALLPPDVLRERTVVIDHMPGSLEINAVCVDHRRGGFISASAVLGRGHRKVLTLTTPRGFPGGARYLEGARAAFAESGVPFNDELVSTFVPGIEAGRAAFESAYAARRGDADGPVTAVICFCDAMALGVYAGARRLGLAIPRDLSVVGYDDTPMASFTDPQLTTVRNPVDLVASNCARVMSARLLDRETSIKRILLEPSLVERGSVAGR
jgi:DNA-binding LacI/PurR family transcriptional regulator